MKPFIIRCMRDRRLQGMWERLFHISKIGMNFWGGASVYASGEIPALQYIERQLLQAPVTEPIVIFDVGANLGQYATLCAKTFSVTAKKVYSFEPSSGTFDLLVEQIKKSELTDVVEAHHLGFSDGPGELFLYSPGVGASVASVYDLTAPISKFREECTETVRVSTIDKFCQEHQIDHIDLLKVDIEGHEYHALLGANEMIQTGKVSFIQFEFGDCHMDAKVFFRDFYDLLSKQYQLYRIVPNGLRKITSYSTDLEVFSTINYLAEYK